MKRNNLKKNILKVILIVILLIIISNTVHGANSMADMISNAEEFANTGESIMNVRVVEDTINNIYINILKFIFMMILTMF